jgi:serine/threonine protein kinase
VFCYSHRIFTMSDAAAAYSSSSVMSPPIHHVLPLSCGGFGCAIKVSPPAACMEKDSRLPESLQLAAVFKLSRHADTAITDDKKMQLDAEFLKSVDPHRRFTVQHVRCTQPYEIREEAARLANAKLKLSEKDTKDDLLEVLRAQPDRPTILMEYGGIPISMPAFEQACMDGFNCSLGAFIHAFRSVCFGVQELAKAGRVHMDIKPENLTFIPQGASVPKMNLIDFGNLLDVSELLNLDFVVGNTFFLPPEYKLLSRSAGSDDTLSKMSFSQDPRAIQSYFYNYNKLIISVLHPVIKSIYALIQPAEIGFALELEVFLNNFFVTKVKPATEQARVEALIQIHDKLPLPQWRCMMLAGLTNADEIEYTNYRGVEVPVAKTSMDVYGTGVAILCGIAWAIEMALRLNQHCSDEERKAMFTLLIRTLQFSAKCMHPNPAERVKPSNLLSGFNEYLKGIEALQPALDLFFIHGIPPK